MPHPQPRTSRPRRPLGRLVGAALLLMATADTAWKARAQEPETPAPVLRIALDSPIHPMATRFVSKVLEEAAERRAAAVVLELNTPGGSLPATRRLCQAFLASEVPVIVYVSPAGAQAASAGFFLLMAADVAAMAPGTNTGSAHPVGGGGEDLEGAMGEKVLEDSLALIRSLAEQRGRDLDLVQAAVRESRSMTATEAFDAGLVDAVAADLPTLLATLDGRPIRRGERRFEPALAGAPVEDKTMSSEQRLLAALAHPQIAGLLMAFGLLGLYAEISNPGLILPGVVGGICLILGFFALSVLPINYAGLALLGLALVLFVTETQVPSFGVLTLGGAVSFALGLIMLVEEMDPATRPSPWWAIGTAGLVAAVAGAGSLQTLRMRSRAPVTGRDGMLGEVGVAKTALAPQAVGRVVVRGETWRAEADAAVQAGAEVVVTDIDGLTLKVRGT